MDVVTGIALAVVTLVVVVTGLVVVGFAILFRRRGDRGLARPARSSDTSIGGLSRRAGSLLVQLDDALRDADDELGFAIAQFGPDRARPYADALASARGKVAEAFRLKQALDDAYPDSDREKREWTLQIIALCEQAATALQSQDAAFGQLRSLEVNAAGTLRDVRDRIAATGARVDAARSTVAALGSAYDPATVVGVSGNVEGALEELSVASRLADSAEPGISQTGVNAVSATLQEALQSAHRADQLLDAVDRTAADLAAATAALAELRAKTKADLAEARAQVDAAPDADTGAAILSAVAAVDAAVSGADESNPVAALDAIGDAVAGLDLALASARNQAQRFEHARTAYAGTLISAKSQIAVARDLIASTGGGVDARTRLAEAERQLMLAENEADPVAALDTIRRAVTHARDADALARYSALGRR